MAPLTGLPGLAGAARRRLLRPVRGAVLLAIVAMGSAGTAAAAGAPALAAPGPDAATRGELLYGIHCIACHNEQVHWRDRRLATDWASLKRLVRRWQDTANLNWSDDDIDEVARHLNDTIYRFPRRDQQVGWRAR
jgi:mono/diheme cytochrome c family protein